MGTTTSTDDDAYTAQREAARANIIQRESGGQNIFSSAGDPNMPREQKGSGYYQFIPSSWREAANIAGIDTSKYPLAIDAPRNLQDQAFDAYYAKYGERPWAQSAPGNARAQMASTDTSTDTTTDPSVLSTPALAATPDQLRQALGLLGTSVGGGDNKNQSWVSKIGAAIGGGQGNLTGADAENAGTRSLMNFGMGLLANSGYHPVRTTMGEALAAGLQGAQASELGSQQLQRDTVQKALGYLQEQQKTGILAGNLQIQQKKLDIELQRLRMGLGLPNPLGGGLATPGAPPGPPATTAATPPPVTTGPAPTAPVAPAEPTDIPPADIPRSGVTAPPAASPAPAQGDQLPSGGTAAGSPSGLVAGPGAPSTVGPAKPMPGTAGDVSAIIGGMKNAATDLAAPRPGATTVAGVPTPQSTTQQPSDTRPDTRPDSALTYEEFRQRHMAQPSPDDIKGFTIAPDPKALSDAATEVQQAQKAQAAAAETYRRAYAGLGGDPNKSLSDYNTANAALTTANQNYNKLAQDAQQATATNRLAWQKNQDEQMRQLYVDAQTRAQTVAENEKNRQAELEKTRVQAGYTLQQKQADADMSIAQKDIEERNTEAGKAGRVIPILQQMGPQLANLPQGAIGGLLAKFDPTGDLTGILSRMGVVDPSKATAAQLLMAARNYLSIELKPAATGSLRNAEMDNLKSFTPGQLNTPQAQQEMLARLIAYQRRTQDEADFAGKYFGRTDPQTGKTIYDNRGLQSAMNAPVKYDQNGNVTGGGLGPVVPEPPPLTAPDAEHAAYQNYVKRNVAPGMPYQTYEAKKDANGNIQRDANGKAIPQRVTKVQGYD